MTSIFDPDRFRFDRSPYERPNFKFRCGRGAAWGKPCVRGPNPDGSCGGTATCNPIKNQNGRFECRRPAIAGGPCSDGPLPDGTCALRQPPCTPRRSLRGLRGRLGLLALGLVLALVLGLSGISSGRIAGISSWDPGPLTTGHASFIAAGDCTACHAQHNSGPTNWITAVFSDSDITGKCTECHVFGGPARQAHNRINPDRPDIGETTCQMCHTEHKGEFANIVEINDVQCATCHETKFSSFSTSHPAFGESFPYFKRTAIKFNHSSHFAKHFGDARFADRAPETCLACHSQEPNQRSLVRSGFEETCEACHGGVMAQRELILLRLPEFVENTIDEDSVIEACGPIFDDDEEDEEEFESVSIEESSVVGAFLLDVVADDPDEYTKPMQELILAMAEGGLEPLAELIDERADREISTKLLAGLNPESVKWVACAWAANLEYELPADATMGGWYGDYLELRYRPQGHGDKVARSWIEFAIAAGREAEDDDAGERAIALRESMIDPKEGVGGCMKCHSVTAIDEENNENDLAVEWRAREVVRSPRNLNFSHGIHLRLFDAKAAQLSESEKGCRWCHVLDPEADFASGYTDFDALSYTSNFKPIAKETCADCHSEGNLREDCQLCHDYHREPSFNIRISSHAE
ncbi:MAG: hypothetical protein VYA71_02200 [Pseudomonadota bacterium]|nr:hypothetical protein [Pseudomonadota bacterium]